MLPTLFTLEPWNTDALDRFIGACLTSAGVWTSPRTSDGIINLRVLDRGDEVGVVGQIYEIDQSLHWFTFGLAQVDDGIEWMLAFDLPDKEMPDVDHLEDHAWRVMLTGNAAMTDGVLAVVGAPTRRGHPSQLPKGQVRVVDHWLVIGVEGNPTIRVDLRLLDRVERDGLALILVRGELEVSLGSSDALEVEADLANRVERKAATQLVVVSSSPDGSIEPYDALAGRAFVIGDKPMSIGRAPDNDIAIAHPSLSRTHAVVSRSAIENKASSNGVRVNGVEHHACALKDGDIVDLGHVRMRFESHEVEPPSLERFVLVGNDPIVHRDKFICIGEQKYRLNEVSEYADQGANLPLPGGRLVQAALAMLVVDATSSQPPGPP